MQKALRQQIPRNLSKERLNVLILENERTLHHSTNYKNSKHRQTVGDRSKERLNGLFIIMNVLAHKHCSSWLTE